MVWYFCLCYGNSIYCIWDIYSIILYDINAKESTGTVNGECFEMSDSMTKHDRIGKIVVKIDDCLYLLPKGVSKYKDSKGNITFETKTINKKEYYVNNGYYVKTNEYYSKSTGNE